MLALVVLGQFNPAIFQPSWFGAEGLIGATEAENATVEIVHQQVSDFTADWLHVQVTRDRLLVRTERESHFEPLRDLLVGTLTLLRHTPSAALGVNHDTSLAFGNRDSFDKFGWTLVPPTNWEGVLQRPGMASVEEQGERTDGRDGWVRVRIQPVLDAGEPHQAIVAVNDHFAVSKSPEAGSTELITTLLGEEWNDMTTRASAILDHCKGMIQ